MDIIDYGRSFVCTTADLNSPRFRVESRCRIMDDRTGDFEDYVQCASCKSEHTFAEKGLFTEDNYDFLPVFGERHGVIFRRKAWLNENYKSIVASEGMWDGPVFHLVEPASVRVLESTAEIRRATHECLPIVAQTEIANEQTQLRAVIECPVKTMNIHDERDLYQVDTGPVIFPDIARRHEPAVEGFSLAFVAFNAPHFADFVIEAPTPIHRENNEVARVHHYSERKSLTARNTLYAIE